MSILRKYVFRELIGPIIISALFFSFLMMLRQLFSFAELLLEAGVGLPTFLEILGIIVVTLLIITIPMAALLGCLIGIGRLTSENEILAMRVAGISLPGIFFPVFIAAAFGSAGLMWCGFDPLPRLLQRLTDKEDALKFEVLTNLEPGRNYELPEMKGADFSLFYEQRLPAESGDGPYTLRMRQIALRVQGDSEEVVGAELDIGSADESKDAITGHDRIQSNEILIFAKGGVIKGDLTSRSVLLELEEGTIIPLSFIELRDDDELVRRFREDMDSETTIRFQSLRRVIEVKNEDRDFRRIDPRQLTVSQLREILKAEPTRRDGTPLEIYEDDGDLRREWKFYLSCRNELYQRYTLPWSLLAFVLIAIPLAVELRPTAKSFAFIMALGLILLYYVMLTSAGAVGMTYSPYTFLAYLSPNLLIGGVGIFLFWRVQA